MWSTYMYLSYLLSLSQVLRSRSSPSVPTLYVEGLTRHVDKDWVHKIFSECGEIDNIDMAPIRGHLRSRGYAYVEFKDQEAADKAWVTLHGG